jgi:hypothetical protein
MGLAAALAAPGRDTIRLVSKRRQRPADKPQPRAPMSPAQIATAAYTLALLQASDDGADPYENARAVGAGGARDALWSQHAPPAPRPPLNRIEEQRARRLGSSPSRQAPAPGSGVSR